MRKNIFLFGLFALSALTLGACASKDKDNTVCTKHTYVKHEAVSAGCEIAGNEEYYTCNNCDTIFNADKEEIESIPTLAASHNYTLVEEKAGNCHQKGEIAHYVCSGCEKLFDLTKQEITDAEGEFDYTNHTSAVVFTAQTQPQKLAYYVGESFDPMGMTVLYKCDDCDGEILDNQFLTYTYQTEANKFSLGDTKISVGFNNCFFDIALTVEKAAVQIQGVEESYTTTCGVAPTVNATCNLPECEIFIKYYDGEEEVSASEMTGGKSYTAKVYVKETEAVIGAEILATVNVEHGHAWQADEEDGDKLLYKCACGSQEEYYVKNNQIMYVDDEDMSIDLSSLVVGTDNVAIKSIQQIQLLNEKNKVDIVGENTGSKYTFPIESYEKTSFDVDEAGNTVYWTPYELALSVLYEVEGLDCEVTLVSKYVDKVIREAEDLLKLAYTGKPNTQEGGESVPAYYVLANDIDASGLSLGTSNPAWEALIGFRGVFDGNGYTIRNLKGASHGLFGAIGYNAKIQNVSFENLTVPEGAYALAYAMRNSYMENVKIEFSADSPSFALALEANDCEFDDVTIKLKKGQVPFFVGGDATNPMPETITFKYYTYYTVSFDTDGGNQIDSVDVTEGSKLPSIIPTKVDADGVEYEFLGWYKGEDRWDFSMAVTENMTLVAKWAKASDSNVLLNASIRTLEKWDYGNPITVTSGYDETYGDYWNVTIADGAEQSIQHDAIKTSGYDKVCFYVYNPLNHYANLQIHGGYGAWGLATVKLTEKAWTKVEVSVSAFTADVQGKIFLVIQEPNALSLAGEWKITSFYGEKENTETPTDSVATSLTFGVATDSGTRNEYGQIYNVSQEQYYIDNNIKNTLGTLQKDKLANALPAGYDYFEFWIYNPTDTAYSFHLAGDCNGAWTDSETTVALQAKGWTKVTISAKDIELNKQGQWYFYILDGDGAGATKTGWQISTVYAVKA